MTKEIPSYFAVIPATVRYSKDVTDGAKLLYGEITSLCNKEGFCWASNKYFADLYGVSTDTISRWISQLAAAGFLLTMVDSAEGNSRKIWLPEAQGIRKNADRVSAKMPIGYPQKSVDPIRKNAEHNNKENNKINNKEEEKRASAQTSSTSSSFDGEKNLLPVEEEKTITPPVPAPPPSFIDSVSHVIYGVDVTAGRVPFSLSVGVNEIRANQTMKEAFFRSYRVPLELFESYLSDFELQEAAVSSVHHTQAELSKHFLNYSKARYRSEQDRAAAQQKTGASGQTEKYSPLPSFPKTPAYVP